MRILQPRSEEERAKVVKFGRDHPLIAETMGHIIMEAAGQTLKLPIPGLLPQCMLCSFDLRDPIHIAAFVVISDTPTFDGKEIRVSPLCRNCAHEDRNILETRVVDQINKTFLAGRGAVVP